MSYNGLSNLQRVAFDELIATRGKSYADWVRHKTIDPRKDILIVGDRLGPKADRFGTLESLAPFNSELYSGGWINEQLVINNITNDRLMWVNAYTPAGEEEPAVILKREWKLIFALGNNAALWLSRNRVEFIRVDHPQFHRRFKGKFTYPLIQLLKDALCQPSSTQL